MVFESPKVTRFKVGNFLEYVHDYILANLFGFHPDSLITLYAIQTDLDDDRLLALTDQGQLILLEASSDVHKLRAIPIGIVDETETVTYHANDRVWD